MTTVDVTERVINARTGQVTERTIQVEAPPVVPVTAAHVRAEAARRMALIAQPYSREERETWPQQIAEAEAYMAGDQSDMPMLTVIAMPRGLTVAQMATLVLTLRAQFKAATAAILAAQATLIAMDPIPQDFADAEYWP
ncbi:MAG: hypothetical protein COZ09_10185 [Comamonadaceae bacterium CG_4_10_14_3_um_filter_60_42]|nr:MAG: hypothetical protein COZ09_10185 [Comamonadaceae bacterium CG_4_10_14_3_um_filter_60_42]